MSGRTRYNPALLDLDEFGEAEIHLHEDVLPGLAHTGERQTQVLREREKKDKDIRKKKKGEACRSCS